MILPIDKERIPYQFEIELDGGIFVFEVHYNGEHDFFTVDVYKGNEIIVYGEKVVYGQPLFGAYTDTRLPSQPIVPLDLSGRENRVTYENLGESVFLYIGEIEGASEDVEAV